MDTSRDLLQVNVLWGSSIFHYYSLIHSDEGLTLESSVFESFTVANLPYIDLVKVDNLFYCGTGATVFVLICVDWKA